MILKETDRIILRHFEMKDAGALFQLDSDPEVLTYLHVPAVASIEEVEQIIRRIQGEYDSDGTARLIVEEKETGEVMGWAGLKYIRENINGLINFHDVGYRLRKQFWGKGFATEAAIASLDYGFDDLGLSEIYGMADVNNIASNKILTKIGMTNQGVFDYEGVPHNCYHIEKRVDEG
ncbi:MAG: ribosomal-protein-alanine N-acetyltransferase [Patescibacteria group bacterium]|jgi:ribosomal-protein-alanine N-acetyltransferase